MPVFQVIRCGFGMPAFNNDEIVIPEFIKLGVKPAGCLSVCGDWLYRNGGTGQVGLSLHRDEFHQSGPYSAGCSGSGQEMPPWSRVLHQHQGLCWATLLTLMKSGRLGSADPLLHARVHRDRLVDSVLEARPRSALFGTG